jgi:hypothetical protein
MHKRSSILYTIHQILFGLSNDNDMGGARGTSGGQERCMQAYWWYNFTERDLLEDLRVDWRKYYNGPSTK